MVQICHVDVKEVCTWSSSVIWLNNPMPESLTVALFYPKGFQCKVGSGDHTGLLAVFI